MGARLRKPVRELIPGRDGGEGLSDEALAEVSRTERDESADAEVPVEPGSLKLVVAGGTAGRFTAIVPGWPFRNAPSRMVFRKEQAALAAVHLGRAVRPGRRAAG